MFLNKKFTFGFLKDARLILDPVEFLEPNLPKCFVSFLLPHFFHNALRFLGPQRIYYVSRLPLKEMNERIGYYADRLCICTPKGNYPIAKEYSKTLEFGRDFSSDPRVNAIRTFLHVKGIKYFDA